MALPLIVEAETRQGETLQGDAGSILADRILIDDFEGHPPSPDLPKGWSHLTFPKIDDYTSYKVVLGVENSYLKGVSRASASGLYKELSADLNTYPVLRWRWAVDGVIDGGDARKRSGDDYSARIYVAFALDEEEASLYERVKHRIIRSIYGKEPPWRAINYIWANRLEKGSHTPNPYTESTIMVAVESGGAFASDNPEEGIRWINEERNILQDYMRLFKTERRPKLQGIALMTDSDNTGEKGVGRYDDLYLYIE